jgi:hypothetical protein
MTHQPRVGARLCSAALAALSATLLSSEASADHTAATRITDQTAYTREQGHVRLGLLTVEAGAFDWLTVGTYWLPWAAVAPNLHVKLRLFQSDPVALAVRVGGLTFDTKNLSVFDDTGASARLFIGTVEPLASFRFNDTWTLSASTPFTAVRVDGEISDDAFQGAGAGAVSNLQATLSAEYRLTTKTAFVLHGRYLIFQRTRARANVTVPVDAYTTVDAHAAASTSAFDFPRAFSVVPSVVFSWQHLYIRAGVGYGNWSLPLVNVVLPRKTPVPDLDVAYYF